MRVFRSAEGKPLTASFEGMSGDKVSLRREDGKVFEIESVKLSAEDRIYVGRLAQQSGDDAKKLNTAAGHEIASGSPFASRKAEDLARLLLLRPESQSKYGRSWRLYAAYAKDYKLFGAMPYSVALYSNQDGLATNMSIVYAKKGDFGSTAGMAQEHFKAGSTATVSSLAEAMNRDEELGISLPAPADVHTGTIRGGGVDWLDGGEILRERGESLRVGATQLFAAGA